LARLECFTGRSSAFLAAEAISAYLDTNEWQVAGITKALSSLDRGFAPLALSPKLGVFALSLGPG